MPQARTTVVVVVGLIAGCVGWLSAQVPQAPQGQPGQPPPIASGTGFIAGQVIETASGRPVPQAFVTISFRPVPGGGGRGLAPSSVVTDSQGRFFFSDLPAGNYAFNANKAGYMLATINNAVRTVELADAQRITDLKIRLQRLSSLAGTVRDDAGDPVVGTEVIALYRALVGGRRELQPAGRTRTDDTGAYRLSGLRAGEYFICACGRDPIPIDGLLLTTLASDPLQLLGVAAHALVAGADAVTLDRTLRTFAPTFYPASATIARATPVTVEAGAERAALDILSEAVRATRVSGAIVGAPSPVLASSMRLVPAGESAEGASVAGLSPMLVQPDGRFDFTGVPPGQYVLRVMHAAFAAGAGGPTGAALAFIGGRGGDFGSVGAQLDQPPLWAAEPITVGDDGARDVRVQLRAATKINGKFQFDGTAAPPAPAQVSRATLFALPTNPDPGSNGGGLGRANPDGTFQVRGVVPGRHSFVANGIPPWTTLKSLTIAGVDSLDLPVEIETTDLSDVVVTFTDRPQGTITGTVAGGVRGEDLTALLFPADRRYWPVPTARRFKALPISRSGSFDLGGAPSGDYFVAVIPDEASREWMETARLEVLSRSATRVTVVDGEKKTIEVRR